MSSFDNNSSNSIRVDLHCHSLASNWPSDAVLRALNCPESYSEPEAVYAQAKARGMAFVTITDHDSIEGVKTIADRADVIVGEELSCRFPEDGCLMHVVVWGLTAEDHEELQKRAKDIYRVADYLEEWRLAHAVAHPLYRQNEKLQRGHLEQLMLLFKGFECLNGAHSPLHREAFEPLLDRLDEEEIARLAQKHRLRARWPEPWIKSRTGGSDDHGLLNVGRTWTEFPAEAISVEAVLECLRTGRCRPGGETGSALKLAHTIYSVAVRYYGRHLVKDDARLSAPGAMIQAMVGEEIRAKFSRKIAALWPFKRRMTRRVAPSIGELFTAAAKKHFPNHPSLLDSLKLGLPPLGEHEEIFSLVSAMNRDISEQIAEGIAGAIDQASFHGLFDWIAAGLAQQFVLLPYYFALFHQNKERRLLRELTGKVARPKADSLKVGLFTDTFDDVNGVCRFLRDISAQARRQGRNLTVMTCSRQPTETIERRINFAPLGSHALPCYPQIQLHLPPLLDVLKRAEQEQFDVIHVSTPGPMGLCGWLASRMLRAPLVGTYHTDFPAYAEQLTGDARVARGTTQYMQWFYGRMERVLARSRTYRASLAEMGLESSRVGLIQPATDTEKFSPGPKIETLWRSYGIEEPHRLLCVGRISVEKNLPMLVEIFRRLSSIRRDVALIVVGDGPYRVQMQQELSGLPAYFFGMRGNKELVQLYQNADLLLFPSQTDTLGQVVMEAQACGLPVLVNDECGPREMVDEGVTGRVLPRNDAAGWVAAIDQLLDDQPQRLRMSRTATQRASRFSLERCFEQFWADHLAAATSTPSEPTLRNAIPHAQH
ncbi:MAG TPA: glycosyltransferase [Tepidisphaeraceae bacterium]|nr:glycosyltransferase [Tepidisphaeraceae bacterium]